MFASMFLKRLTFELGYAVPKAMIDRWTTSSEPENKRTKFSTIVVTTLVASTVESIAKEAIPFIASNFSASSNVSPYVVQFSSILCGQIAALKIGDMIEPTFIKNYPRILFSSCNTIAVFTAIGATFNFLRDGLSPTSAR